jgi:hypothetical protein
MKERLVEDWLIRINERGYEVPFAQSLVSKGYRVLRVGHSPTEHGKDVLAIAPDGAVCGYQLKSGDFGQADVSKHHEQLNMLVEARPTYPGLPASFIYRPYLVTTGEFKYPAISLINELNASWTHRGLPTLELINGRQLHVDFVGLSSDFWPSEAPAVRRFRELYLVDGRGDLDLSQFAAFLVEILRGAKSALDLERRIAGANLFASYLLGEFYYQGDHWSVVQGWTVCAAQIAWAGESGGFNAVHWEVGFSLAKEAALAALETLHKEALSADGLRVKDRELDDFTRTRNTISIAAAACWDLIAATRAEGNASKFESAQTLTGLIGRSRVLFWGEGAFPDFAILMWLLEKSGRQQVAKEMVLGLIEGVARRNARHSEDPFQDPYVSPDEFLTKLFDGSQLQTVRKEAIESYSLLAFVTLAVRRNLRSELESLWHSISYVDLASFRPATPADVLLWRCDEGEERQINFDQPQKWDDLRTLAFRDDRERLPRILCDDPVFALIFLLVFRHRAQLSLVKHLDDRILLNKPEGG